MSKITVEEGLSKNNSFLHWKAYSLANRDVHAAEDLVQEASCIALESKESWKSFNKSFLTWMTYNLLSARKTYYVGRRTYQDSSMYAMDNIDDNTDVYVEPTDDIDLKSLISNMPHPDIAMYAYCGYKQIEICDIMGLSLATIKRRAKKNHEFYKETVE